MTKHEMKKALTEFDNATDSLAEVFVKKYFGKEYIEDDTSYWIGSQDDDREVLRVGDYFFNLDRIIDALRYNATSKQLFNYYDLEVDSEKELKINFKNYLKK